MGVLDLAAGASQNRLRYLADFRNDPLSLHHIGELSFEIAARNAPKRAPMPRPCSPRSAPPHEEVNSTIGNAYPAAVPSSLPPSYPVTPMMGGAPSSTMSSKTSFNGD